MCSWLMSCVADEHALDDGGIPIDERADGQPHPVLGEAAHLEQPSS